ncbi:MAG: polyribonucleotide nucleotidyltransferase [Candidatus Lindowbacteria bacterium]|nr:polyribonucleotide nucleotidyltransferase [Candidatus Lindowbacteria bacterium]
MAVHKVEREIGGIKYSIETGKLAKQAHGSVTIQAGGTIVLVAACVSDKAREGGDFLPLMIDYREQFYAAGKIPGGFFKRESKPDDRCTLTSRLIDRPIRPLMPKGFYNDIVVTALVISSDGIHQGDILAMNGASAALALSKCPFAGPVAGVRIGRIDGKFITNPTLEQVPDCDMTIMMACVEDGITMVESGATEVSEDEIIEGLEEGKKQCAEFRSMIEELVEKVGPIEKLSFEEPVKNEALDAEVRGLAEERLRTASANSDKLQRYADIDEVVADVSGQFESREEETPGIVREVKHILELIEVDIIRGDIIHKSLRPDGRKPDELREISCEVGVLPGAHGSAVFTRGQTQALGVTTLGTGRDKRRRDDLESEEDEAFLFHYNFPPFCVAEAKGIRGTGRREIGHGALAGRALEVLLPDEDEFPYMIRVVSDILESNGSSSMASVCAGALSLMDAGVPIKAPAAGIAMGLISDDQGNAAILTDIQGVEDHFGDMDFKVA